MKKVFSLSLSFFVALVPQICLAQAASGAGNFLLKDGDRVVFYGDSITKQRLYTSFI